MSETHYHWQLDLQLTPDNFNLREKLKNFELSWVWVTEDKISKKMTLKEYHLKGKQIIYFELAKSLSYQGLELLGD